MVKPAGPGPWSGAAACDCAWAWAWAARPVTRLETPTAAIPARAARKERRGITFSASRSIIRPRRHLDRAYAVTLSSVIGSSRKLPSVDVTTTYCLPSLPWYVDGVACAAAPEGDFNANKTSICVYRCLDCLDVLEHR